MKLRCKGLPPHPANCMVVALGAGKSVKFHRDGIVDLMHPGLQLGSKEQVNAIGHKILAEKSAWIELVYDAPPLVAQNKSVAPVIKKSRHAANNPKVSI